MKILKVGSILGCLVLVGCSNAQLKQDIIDYDKARMDAYRNNQIEQNKIRAKEAEALAEAIKVICVGDANPASCLMGTMLTVKTNATAAPVEQMPQRTPMPENKFWMYAMNLTSKVLDVGLSAYGISENGKNTRFGIKSNNDLILDLTDNIGRNAGTHLGDGAQYFAGDYFQDNSDNSDNSIDNSVDVGGNQTIAGRDMDNSDNSVTVGRDQTLVGDDQLIADGSIAIGDANFNTGRIDADGPFVECVSGDSGNTGTGGNGGTGVGSTGGTPGATGGTGLLNCDGGG